ncbi:MAG TPA: DUF3617 domain-containing protein [Bryobacteraceae bacterium]|nr:DUF3617 domain-containing protein [Bryobacteraceae bacterium]
MTARTSFSLAAALFCATAWAADTTPLDVKTGEWEATVTSDSSGQIPVPQALLDKMTPEQRAKMEAALKARATPRTNVHKQCVKKEDLGKPFGNDEERKSCKQNIVTSSSTRQEIHMDCEIGGGKQSGTFKLEAVDSGTVKGTLEMTASNGGRTMNVNSAFSAKWLGPVCSESNK